ncbi:hypothetical protein B0T26DRAFT_641902, partial [Lasiosphaeria miniovina]
EPDGRGTFGIIKACIVTLALAIYTSLHLKVAAEDESGTTKRLRKAKWVAIAMFAPEMVVYIAWCQRHETRRLHKDVQIALEQGVCPPNKRKHPWTARHSWYAFMGGFALSTTPSTPKDDEYIPGSPQLCLTREGVEIMARDGLLPDIPKRHIDDKSKADSLAKLFVVAQSSWMILQCVMRWSSGLFVTALELNTLAHTVCALAIYLIWWEKPLDVGEATILAGDSSIKTVASVLCNTFPERPNEDLAEPSFAVGYGNAQNQSLAAPRAEPGVHTTLAQKPLVRQVLLYDTEKGIFLSRDFESTSPPYLLSLHGTLSSNSWDLQHHLSHRLPYVEPLARRILSWQQFLDPRMSWDGVLSVGVFVFVTLACSGIHASAWNDEFPSAIEHLLWKVSCIYLPCYGILAMVIITAIHRSSKKDMFVFRLRDIGRALSPYLGVFKPFLFGPGAFFLGSLTLGFVGARVYFVVESFLALRNNPRAAYDTPNWTQYLPHL